MTVYVDDADLPFTPRHLPHRRRETWKMSHMIADNEPELHAMAVKIGIARKWYQGDHYDVTQAAKRRALGQGAVLITVREMAHIVTARRRGLAK